MTKINQISFGGEARQLVENPNTKKGYYFRTIPTSEKIDNNALKKAYEILGQKDITFISRDPRSGNLETIINNNTALTIRWSSGDLLINELHGPQILPKSFYKLQLSMSDKRVLEFIIALQNKVLKHMSK